MREGFLLDIRISQIKKDLFYPLFFCLEKHKEKKISAARSGIYFKIILICPWNNSL